MNFPIKAKYPLKRKETPLDIRDFGQAVGDVSALILDLRSLREETLNTLSYKLNEIDSRISKLQDTAKLVQQTKNEAIDLIKEIKTGPAGRDADEERIVNEVISRLPDTEQLVARIVARFPAPLNEKELIKKVISRIPENKASLKIIQETFEADPMSVIDKIMSLPEGKFKLKSSQIEGLEQTIQAFRSQLGRGYLHGGGDTVAAGTNITITTNSGGQKVINATSGGFTILTVTGTVNGVNQIFTVLTKPSIVVSDGVSFTEKDNNNITQWTYVGTTLTLIIPPPINSIFGIQ